MNKKFSDSWSQFWFTPASADDLGKLRFILFTCGSIFHFFYQEVWEIPDFYHHWQPISFFQLLSGPLSNEVQKYIHLVWVASYFLAGLGIFFRPLALMGSILGLIYLGHDYNFGVVYHSHHIYIMSCCILSFSSADKGFVFWRKSDPQFHWKYRWPIRWVQTYVVYVMFLCGLEKVFIGGPVTWAFTDAFYMRTLIHPYKTPLRDWLLDQPLFVSQILSFLGLYVAEVFAPFALFRRGIARFYVYFWISFHVFVLFIFGFHVGFFSQVFAYSSLFFFPVRSKESKMIADGTNVPQGRMVKFSLCLFIFYLFAISQPLLGKREDWPFSWFGMYSGVVSRDGLSRWDFDYIDQNGNRYDLLGENGPYLYLRFDTLLRGLERKFNNQVITPPGDLRVTDEVIHRVREVMVSSANFQMEKQNIQVKGGSVQLRFKRWKRFQFEQRFQPDEDVLVVNIPVEVLRSKSYQIQ